MRLLLRILLLLLLSIPALAQNTSVSGQVNDLGGQAWISGTFRFTFVGPQNVQWTGGVFNPNAPITGSLTVSGAIPATNIPDNNQINPPGTQWALLVCAATLPQVCFSQTLTITGAAQTVSPTPPAITITVPTTPTAISPVSAYADNELFGGWSGFTYYNIVSNGLRVCAAVSGGNCTLYTAGASGVGANPTVNVLPRNVGGNNFGDSACSDNGVQVSCNEPVSIPGTNGGITLLEGNGSALNFQTGFDFLYGYNVGGTHCIAESLNSATAENICIGAATALDPRFQAGADACTQINNAIAALPAAGGIVDARGYTGAQTCTGNISATKPVTILLGDGSTTFTGAGTFAINSNDVRIIGTGAQFSYTGTGTWMTLGDPNNVTITRRYALQGFRVTGTSSATRAIEFDSTVDVTWDSVFVSSFNKTSTIAVAVQFSFAMKFNSGRIDTCYDCMAFAPAGSGGATAIHMGLRILDYTDRGVIWGDATSTMSGIDMNGADVETSVSTSAVAGVDLGQTYGFEWNGGTCEINASSGGGNCLRAGVLATPVRGFHMSGSIISGKTSATAINFTNAGSPPDQGVIIEGNRFVSWSVGITRGATFQGVIGQNNFDSTVATPISGSGPTINATDICWDCGQSFFNNHIFTLENTSYLDVNRASLGQTVLQGRVGSEAQSRFQIDSTGAIIVGPGGATAPVTALQASSTPGVYNLLNGYGIIRLAVSGTAPTISSGFGTSPSIPNSNGTAVFTINVGTGGTATSGVIGLPAAVNGWDVNCKDITTTSATVFMTKQTATTTTTATIGNFNTSAAAAAWVASDVLSCSAAAY